MKKYTQAEIKKFLEPETRFHMSAHVIQTEAVEMCRQLQVEREILVEALKFYSDKKYLTGLEWYMDDVDLTATQALKEVGEI